MWTFAGWHRRLLLEQKGLLLAVCGREMMHARRRAPA